MENSAEATTGGREKILCPKPFQKDISLFLTTLAGKVQIIKTQIMKPASSQNRVYSTKTKENLVF